MVTASPWTDEVRLAHTLADTADALSMARFRAQDLHVSAKADRTLVTEADVAVEEALRATLSRLRSRDGIVGEEGGVLGGENSRRWVIDPIDGTSNFVRGVPVWATLIGLMDGDECVAGVVSAPALGRRWWGAVGAGAYTGASLSQAREIRVSGVSEPGDASLSYSDMAGWGEVGGNFAGLMRGVWRTRAYGDFWSYMLVAEGAVDIAAEPDLKLHDMAAPCAIVQAAGGRFTNLAGEPGPVGPGALATNGLLHDVVVRQLATGGIIEPHQGPSN